MSGEVNFFRKRFFGGFNRDDVVEYISNLAQERNECKEAKELAEAKANTMLTEFEPLRIEAEQAIQRALELSTVFENAEVSIRQLVEERDRALGEAQSMALEVESLKQELYEARCVIDETQAAKNRGTQDIQLLRAEYDNLRDEYDRVKREADEGRFFKIEALESRAKVEKLEAAKKHFEEFYPHLEHLRTTFSK
ncbi:MAG: hypothetical protein FWC75_07570 [Oscillospiraceae bacterium]|nr:hypothetical protein [Oscillospiraceae bacterium]